MGSGIADRNASSARARRNRRSAWRSTCDQPLDFGDVLRRRSFGTIRRAGAGGRDLVACTCPFLCRGRGWPAWCVGTSHTMRCRPMRTLWSPSERKPYDTGDGRYGVEASGVTSGGIECLASRSGGFPLLASSIPWPEQRFDV
jgi:hypothetical protein